MSRSRYSVGSMHQCFVLSLVEERRESFTAVRRVRGVSLIGVRLEINK